MSLVCLMNASKNGRQDGADGEVHGEDAGVAGEGCGQRE